MTDQQLPDWFGDDEQGFEFTFTLDDAAVKIADGGEFTVDEQQQVFTQVALQVFSALHDELDMPVGDIMDAVGWTDPAYDFVVQYALTGGRDEWSLVKVHADSGDPVDGIVYDITENPKDPQEGDSE